MSAITDLLGSEADTLLGHRCKTIDRSALTLPGPDFVDVVIVANLQSHIGSDHPLASADWSQIPAFAKLGLSHDVNVVDMDETGEEIAAVKGLLVG